MEREEDGGAGGGLELGGGGGKDWQRLKNSDVRSCDAILS